MVASLDLPDLRNVVYENLILFLHATGTKGTAIEFLRERSGAAKSESSARLDYTRGGRKHRLIVGWRKAGKCCDVRLDFARPDLLDSLDSPAARLTQNDLSQFIELFAKNLHRKMYARYIFAVPTPGFLKRAPDALRSMRLDFGLDEGIDVNIRFHRIRDDKERWHMRVELPLEIDEELLLDGGMFKTVTAFGETITNAAEKLLPTLRDRK